MSTRPSASSSSPQATLDRKSTRLNSSHDQISYAVFCLKKKKKTKNERSTRHTSRPNASQFYAFYSLKHCNNATLPTSSQPPSHQPVHRATATTAAGQTATQQQ